MQQEVLVSAFHTFWACLQAVPVRAVLAQQETAQPSARDGVILP